MKTNLSRRLTVWVGLPALLLFAGVVYIASARSFSRLVEQTQQYTLTLAQYHSAQIERRLSRAAKIPENLALGLEFGRFANEADLEGFLRELVRQNPEIYGSCLAFQPFSFAADRYYYAPYFFQEEGGPHFVQLGNAEYDYFHWDWYAQPRKLQHAVWSEPYFDDGGGNTVMTTYSVPFFREGRLWGVATIDIAMSQLMVDAQELLVGRTGYTIILSKEGKFVAHPDARQIMTDSTGSLSPNLRAAMMTGLKGFMRTEEPAGKRAAWVAYTPVQEGQFYLATVYPESEVLEEAMHLRAEFLVLGLTGLVAVLVALVVVAKSISRPVTELAHVARQIAAGNLDQEVRVEARTDEVRDLATSFRKMTRDLKMRMEELRYTTMVKERFEGELSAARSIQFSLVAKRFPAFPDRPEVDLHAVIKPARAVGGDFYDFFFIDQDRLCLVVADVAGKGVPAALFMSVSKTLLRANASLASTPADMMAKVNAELCRETATSGMFVSLAFLLLDVRTGTLELCNAGHPAPLRLTPAGEVSPCRSDVNVALGAWPRASYVSSTLQLARGDTVLLYTDGITEALNMEERFYTVERLQELLASQATESVEQITRQVVQDVRAFCGHHEQADDFTLLAVRWLGEGGAPLP